MFTYKKAGVFMRESDRNRKASKKLLDKVGKYFDARNFEKAMDFTNLSIEKDQYNAEAHFVKGNILMAMEEPYKAIQSFNESIALGYRDEVIYINRGTAFKKIKKFDNSLSDYNLALEINPDFYPAYALRGELFLEREDFINAIKDFDSALKIEPDDFDVVLTKCSAYEKSGDLPKALKAVKNFILARKNDDISEYLMARGILYTKCGFPLKAIQDFSQLIDETDYLVTAYKWRYKNYLKIGELQKAKADKEKIKELENNDGVVIEYVCPFSGD